MKRSVTIAGHQTSISLEPLFWDMLRAAAAGGGVSINTLVARIDAERIKSPTPPGLGSAVRIWLVDRMSAAKEEGGGPTATALDATLIEQSVLST